MIRIQNIYYMLAYAFQVLRKNGYKSFASEEFEGTADLFAAILAKGVSDQLKRGLGRTYIEQSEPLSCPRGKIDVSGSIKRQSFIKQQLVCTYDDFSVNCYKNRIIKATMELLLSCDISKERKRVLRQILPYFQDVDALDVNSINWNMRYDRTDQTYKMLLAVCYLAIKGLLQTSVDGYVKMADFLDEQRMCRLYEKFILEYYRREYPGLNASASQIPWALDDEVCTLLPIMQSDIMLTCGDKKLIIDAKYYSHTTQAWYDTRTLHSNNLYQIFTYVKNKAAAGGEVAGMLLYAKTDEITQPNQTYKMSGNTISVKTLDLDCDFALVKQQLNGIVDRFFFEER